MKLKPKTSLMFQAIKSLGAERIDEKTRQRFRAAFLPEDRKRILQQDASVVTGWVYEHIRRICAEEAHTTKNPLDEHRGEGAVTHSHGFSKNARTRFLRLNIQTDFITWFCVKTPMSLLMQLELERTINWAG